MDEVRIEIFLKAVSTAELDADDRLLRSTALRAAGRAYAPYSKFRVGAAVRLQDGTIVEGCNQENVACPSGLCAERVALFAAGASYPDTPPVALALAAICAGEVCETISPCGACRQVMLETERRYGQNIRILMCGRNQTLISPSAKELLPIAYS
ncbi:MAG: cytidine deaminase [Tannerella sp.]|jgi:cytidine deaminase|nr:cytidine deaminase [Tannerella sp.]